MDFANQKKDKQRKTTCSDKKKAKKETNTLGKPIEQSSFVKASKVDSEVLKGKTNTKIVNDLKTSIIAVTH